MKNQRIYLFWTRKIGYILYSKEINASDICPPKRNKWFRQRKWKSFFGGGILTSTCKTRVKVTLLMKTWNDPTVIMDMLPQRFVIKPIWKCSFWHKCWNPYFQESAPHFLRIFDDLIKFLRQIRWKFDPDWIKMVPGTRKSIKIKF